jgi:hypothetical protein
MPQAQAERIVAAMVAGSRMASTEPPRRTRIPAATFSLTGWDHRPGRLEDRRDQPHRPAHGKAAAASVTRPLQHTAAGKPLLHIKPRTSAQTRHHDAHTPEAITWARIPNSPEPWLKRRSLRLR